MLFDFGPERWWEKVLWYLFIPMAVNPLLGAIIWFIFGILATLGFQWVAGHVDLSIHWR